MRSGLLPLGVALLALAGAAGTAPTASAGPGGHARLAMTVWRGTAQAQPMPAGVGGATYGGQTPTGALVIEERELDVPARGDLRVTNVPPTVDPASVQLHAADATRLVVTEQRFLPGAATPTELLARHVGETVTVVTPKGDLTGVLRGVDDRSLVLEVGTSTEVLRRDTYVLDVRLPTGGAGATPSLVWSVTAAKPGKQPVELAYRAAGFAWAPDYVAILDDDAGTVDFGAHATIHNGTSAVFDDAEVTLVDAVASPGAPAARFVVPAHVHLGAAETVQVDLIATHAAAKARPVVTYQPLDDGTPAVIVSQGNQQECTQLSIAPAALGHAELGIELEIPGQVSLPSGHARLYRRATTGARLEVVSDGVLRASAGTARVRIATADTIAGERKQLACQADEIRRRLEERVEITLTNKSPRAQDVVVRELLWRMPMWKIDPASESTKSVRAGPGAAEYNVRVPATGTAKVGYTVVYTW